jgi:hypothetical protein
MIRVPDTILDFQLASGPFYLERARGSQGDRYSGSIMGTSEQEWKSAAVHPWYAKFAVEEAYFIIVKRLIHKRCHTHELEG